MLIGVDFDNTIVCYDQIFHQIALEKGEIPADLPREKSAVRDWMRAAGREREWTAMQGLVYGEAVLNALPFPGVLDFLRRLRERGVGFHVVSHKTKHPYAGPRYDLHAAARAWLRKHGFFDDAGLGLQESDVFLETTLGDKLARVASLGCTHFIDDLPEVLSHDEFPKSAIPVLFDPKQRHAATSLARITAWASADQVLQDNPPRPTKIASRRGTEIPTAADALANAQSLLARQGFDGDVSAEPLSGGANNQVWRVFQVNREESRDAVLKVYFRSTGNERDRLASDYAFADFAWKHGVRQVPRPIDKDDEQGAALFELVEGRRLDPAEVTEDSVQEALRFVVALNQFRDAPEALQLPDGAEACFRPADHLICVRRRVERLLNLEVRGDLEQAALDFARDQLQPALVLAERHARLKLDAPTESLPRDQRAASPSDFGFHNALATDRGLVFLDFEYAGWDDPAKLICDFFCQPAIPAPLGCFDDFCDGVAGMLPESDRHRDRAAALRPAYQLKWCCILLNEFSATGDRRRRFARREETNGESRRREQLEKAEASLERF
ncbi:MAG: aminoglycoside phosphotransferase family protein, partial [Planctomycetales bacterium]